MSDTTSADFDCDQPWVGNLNELVQFAERGIVSKTLIDCPKSKIVHFSMRTGQSLSGHAAGTPATIHVLQGEGTITLGETDYDASPGSIYYMPAGQYHAVKSTDDLVFLLNLFR